MNKIKFSSLLITFFMLIAPLVYADSLFEFGAEVVFPSFWEAEIEHNPPVNSVSSVERFLNIKSSVDFGGYISATAQLLYYFDNDETSVNTVDKGAVSHKAKFYMATPKFQSSYEKINYQIKVTLKKRNDSGDYYAYWPSSDTFHTALITSSTTSYITAADGGTVVFESGNQEYEYTKLVIPANSLSADTNITITQSEIETGADTQDMVSKYIVEPDIVSTEITPANPVSAAFYYGIETNATKFELMYRENPTSEWKKVTITETDNVNKIIKADITKFGEYAIFISRNLSDNDYRPAKRIKVKTRIANGTYDGFRFKYLEAGDVVKIYNVNGKKVREITAGDGNGGFVWDGRKDNGDWAESGTYVYQIKLKDRGRLISGTIAFVW